MSNKTKGALIIQSAIRNTLHQAYQYQVSMHSKLLNRSPIALSGVKYMMFIKFLVGLVVARKPYLI